MQAGQNGVRASPPTSLAIATARAATRPFPLPPPSNEKKPCLVRPETSDWPSRPVRLLGISPQVRRELCLASRLPAQGRIYLDSFTLRTEHRLLLLTHSFTIGCAWRAQPTPWVSNPSRYPAVTREAALIRSAARRLSVRGSGAAPFAVGTRHPLFRGGALGGARYPVSREGSILQRRVAPQ